MQNLSKIFTKINLQILNLILNERLHIREIAERLDCSPAKVLGCIKLFEQNGIVRVVDEKNRRVVQFNRENQLAKQILELIDMSQGKEKNFEERMNLFDAISPLDFRYYARDRRIFEKLQPYLSETAFVRYAAKVESALARALAKRKLCSNTSADEIKRASKLVTAQEVYEEEDKIKHNIRALANSIRNKVGNEAKPFVHFTTTSYDIIATADAARYKDFTEHILLPALLNLQKNLISIALREKDTLQIGRTHGQHAEPITFGFAIAHYVSRLGNRILAIKKAGSNLRGKLSGAVGAYNASSLFFDEPAKFEIEVLGELGLKPSPTSTQIVEAEYLVDYISAAISCFGVLANLADDMRHLQRSEIGEVGEYFEQKQVGSSTMPQKRNPINFENIKGMWKEFMPRITTMYMDQISEHQRDLTNSASMRFIPEMLAGFYVSVIRMNNVMSKLVVDKSNMKKNFDANKGMIAAEPLYIILAALGHPDAHEYVREKTLEAQAAGKKLFDLVKEDAKAQAYLNRFTKKQIDIINNIEKYTGIASKKTQAVCEFWRKELKI